jgi:hypothetical protein
MNEQDLSTLIGAGADPATLAAYLDGLDGEARVREVRSLSGSLLPLLYERCAAAPALTLSDLVPESTAVGQPVIFAGRNNLPLFRLFEKRFARTSSGSIVGFNFQTMSPVTGPGYFTVVPSGSELLIDYTQVPPAGAVPAGWPTVQPNNRGLSHFIYKDLHDFCRRVARDVVIGHATRHGKSLPQYFVLARRP